MKILVAPDKFKGVLTARQAAESIAAGIWDRLPQAMIELLPMADGGEGTAEVICESLGGEWCTVTAHNAAGHSCHARYAWIEKRKTAVFEMSEVAGLKALADGPVDLQRATTFGVGEVILAAERSGAEKIIVGLGGSMTNDAGYGMARALGYSFLCEAGRVLGQEVGALTKLARVLGQPKLNAATRIVGAADVMNPLLGKEGATRVFAAQKGADQAQMEQLEQCLRRFSDIVERDLRIDCRSCAGAGAAGGLGFGLMAFCGAEVHSGFELVARVVGLEKRIAGCDVVVTGEGCLDKQTLAGKAPGQIAAMAARFGKKVFAVVGRSDGDERLGRLFDGIFEVAKEGAIDADHVRRAPELLRAGGDALGRRLSG